MVFPVFLVIFIVFWTGYLLFGVSMVYRIKEYSLPSHPAPRIFTTAFIALSIVLFDTWIITSRRIIDIEQQGLFSRHVAEIPLSRVQDITIEVNGILETLLRFGTIRIQTAGERDFFINDVPRLQELKNIILTQLEDIRAHEEPAAARTNDQKT